MLQRPVQGRGLTPAAGVVEHRDPGISGQQFGRAVGRTVGHPGDAEFSGGVFQCPAVFHFGGNDLLFVVSGYQQRRLGRFGRRGMPFGGAYGFAELHQGGQQDAVSDVGVDDQQGADPEKNGCDSHGLRVICAG